jgi:poly(hydroxyalkanoate) depolymerase family esterase
MILSSRTGNFKENRRLVGFAVGAVLPRAEPRGLPRKLIKVSERLPLVVMLHGCGQNAAEFAAVSRMNHFAMKERFCVLHPEQSGLVNPHRCWNWFETDHGRAFAEVDLIFKAVDLVVQLHPEDRTRVVIAGLSAGASMAALLALQQPAFFRGVVMHSGIPAGTAHSTATAIAAMHGQLKTLPLATSPHWAASGLPPLLVIHSDIDGTVSPANASAAAGAWAQAMCALETATRAVQRGQRHAMWVIDFKRNGNTTVTLVRVAGLGHAWSGGASGHAYSDARGPDASRMVWAFAKRHFRPTALKAQSDQTQFRAI